jgi:uncharacterized YccA/Bax inhibitor family protein
MSMTRDDQIELISTIEKVVTRGGLLLAILAGALLAWFFLA